MGQRSRKRDINRDIVCNEPLDAVKCLPEFAGTQETYVSWRQAAVGVYYIFKNFEGSSRYYQAAVIIRTNIRDPADAVLFSFGTVLNFDAIINRLDFTYSDKRTMHFIDGYPQTGKSLASTVLRRGGKEAYPPH